MRQKENQSKRAQAVEYAAEVDYHVFTHSGMWMWDIDMTGELCDCPHDIAIIKQQIARN